MLAHATHSVENGGQDTTEYMLPVVKDLIEQEGLNFESIDMETSMLMGEIKQKLAFVPLDYDLECYEENNPDQELTSYVLPDGEHIITVPLEVRCNAGELLVRPEIINKADEYLVANVFDSLTRCDEQLRSVNFNLIILIILTVLTLIVFIQQNCSLWRSLHDPRNARKALERPSSSQP